MCVLVQKATFYSVQKNCLCRIVLFIIVINLYIYNIKIPIILCCTGVVYGDDREWCVHNERIRI